MPSLDMQGSFPLTASDIDNSVTKKSPGNYALGYSKDGSFYVRYVGRSDSDVNARLKSHLNKHPKCDRFMFSYASSPKDAFEKECKNYHDFTPQENSIHPDQPSNNQRRWKCPNGCA